MKIISKSNSGEFTKSSHIDVNKNKPQDKQSQNRNQDKKLKEHQQNIKKPRQGSQKNREATPKNKAEKPKASVSDVKNHHTGNTSTYERFISLLRFNITFKLTLGYSIRVVSMLAFIFITAYLSFSYFLFYQTQTALSKNDLYIQSLFNAGFSYDSQPFISYIKNENLDLYIYDYNKSLIYKSTEATILYDDVTGYSEYDFKNFPEFPTMYHPSKYYDSSKTLYYFVIGKSMDYARTSIEATLPIGVSLFILLVFSSIISSARISGKHLKPITIMTEQVKDMSANNLSKRLNVSGTKDELKDLAKTFNQMLDDIQKSYEREKQFVSDASHELRTPIAVIKGYAGMLNRWGKDDPAILEESIQAILGETDNMHSLVESLLFIARNDKGALKMDLDDFSISELMQEIVKETQLIDSQHSIVDKIEPGLMFYGSIDKIKQALRIFVDNSIKYTPDNGEIRINLRSSKFHLIIELADNGIGISTEDLPHVFDRFYRADKSRTKLKDNQHGGTGLGLSIAKIIIEQHGGSIHVDSELNKGTTFIVMLPLKS